MEKNEDFNFKQQPGMTLKKDLAINSGTPLVSIATPYYNSAEYIMQTAYSILNQTFPYWEWVIVNDGSTEENTKDILKKVENLDKRIKVYTQENQGRLAARDNAVKYTTTDLVLTLDSDDVIDETFLECAYWTLKTNPEATWAYNDMVTFDGQNFLWKKIFDCEQEKVENILPVCSLIRKQAIFDVGGYSAVDKDVHEDWHMWLRMIEKGMYPVRMNYYGFWYRQKKEGGIFSSISKNKEKQKHAEREIKKQAKRIRRNVSALQYPMSTNFDYNSYPYTFDWDREPINIKGKKMNLLFIFPWFELGGADKFNLDLISNLDKNKYDITIITTEPCDYIWRQKFEEHATVFDLTSFLHRRDWPAFIYYLLKSRNIELAFISNSFYGYYVLPWLKCKCPDVIFTDYIHSETWGWRNGGYPRESTAVAGLVDKTYTCTKYIENIMYNKMERNTKNIETVYIGVDTDNFKEENVNIDNYPEIVKYKDQYKNKKIILFCARVSIEKRPLFAIEVFKRLCEKYDDLMLFIVGSGDRDKETRELVKKLNLTDKVIFFGKQSDTRPFYKLAYVELICSLVEGLTLTTYEGLSMKTPVVTANIGGQAELVDNSCGRVVDNIQSPNDLYLECYEEEEILRYVKALEEILTEKDYEKMKSNCRNKVLNGFTINNMIQKLDNDFENMIKNGTTIDYNTVKNEELYRQYLLMYNQVDQRTYFPDKGGYNNLGITNYDQKFQEFKDKMWKKPAWRKFISFLNKRGIMKFIKNKSLDEKIKRIIIK